MAHLSLQIGAAIPVPIGFPDYPSRDRGWRQRALREVAVQASPEERWPADQLSACAAHHTLRSDDAAHAITATEAE